MRAILQKLRPEPVHAPLPPRKVYEPPLRRRGENRAGHVVSKLIARVKSLVDWAGTVSLVIGWLGWTAAITGIFAAVGGAIWAVVVGVPPPIAIMAGYCTVAGGVFLTLSPLAYRAFSRIATSPRPHDAAAPQKPNAAVWQHVPKFTLSQGACLLADVTPGSRIVGDVEAWFETLSAEIRSKEIAYIPSIRDAQQTVADDYHPRGDTEISRAELQRFAERHDIRPHFLFPD